MILTVCLAIIILFGICLMLYSAVALIQDKRLFGSAPEDVQEKILDHKERFKGAHVIGWIFLAVSVIIITLSIIYGAWDGIQENWTIWDFFTRFLILFTIYKLFDMIFLDWYLLTKSHFYQHYYPETEGCRSFDVWGFNIKSQLIKLFIVFPIVAFVLALIVSLL